MKIRALRLLIVAAVSGLLLIAASSTSALPTAAPDATLTVEIFNQRMLDLENWKRSMADRLQNLERLTRQLDPNLRSPDPQQEAWKQQTIALLRDLQGQLPLLTRRLVQIEELERTHDTLAAQRIARLQTDLASAKQNIDLDHRAIVLLTGRLDTAEQNIELGHKTVSELTDRVDLAEQKIEVDRKAATALRNRLDLAEKNLRTEGALIDTLMSK